VAEFAEIVKVGTTIELTGTFTSAGSATATDPATITAHIRLPTGVVQHKVYGIAPELTRTGTGVYILRYELALPGTYWIAFEGTGAVDVVDETAFKAQVVNAA
jgi:hypothetical protein